jgi:Flp pilus assembly protein TadB
MKQITLLLTLIAFCFSAITATAAVATAPATTTTITAQKADMPAWKMKIVEKFKSKLEKQLNKKAPAEDINIPGSTRTWLIYWIVGLLASIVLAFILPPIVYQLLGTATLVAFIIWVLKYLNVVS